MKHPELQKIWEDRLANFDSSGLTVAAWCTQHQVKPHQFFYWQRKTKSVKSNEVSGPVRWLSLEYDFCPAEAKPDSEITVQVGGASILVSQGFDPDLFLDIVRLLQRQ